MTELFKILSQALQSTPSAVIPFIVTLAVIAYLSYRAYAEFKAIYKKVNADKLELTNRIAESERKLALTDEKSIMLAQKLERIEESLDKVNTTLVRLATTLEIMREEKSKK